MKSNKDNNQKGSGLGYLLIGAIGLVGGFIAGKLMNELSDKEKEAPNRTQNQVNNPQNSTETKSKSDDSTQSSLDNEGNQCEDVFCPITLEIMNDPVISKNCGHSFENSAISQWLSTKNFCPKCNCVLSANDLVKNYSLKNTIEYMRKHN